MELPATESLRCFVAEAERLNFRAAAKLVGLTLVDSHLLHA